MSEDKKHLKQHIELRRGEADILGFKLADNGQPLDPATDRFRFVMSRAKGRTFKKDILLEIGNDQIDLNPTERLISVPITAEAASNLSGDYHFELHRHRPQKPNTIAAGRVTIIETLVKLDY